VSTFRWAWEGQEKQGPQEQGRDQDETDMGVDAGERRRPGRGLEAKGAL
jgi:hypothetical protein